VTRTAVRGAPGCGPAQIGGFVALAPTGAHAARATLVTPRPGPAPLAGISAVIGRYR
jgi:hypothetical protein